MRYAWSEPAENCDKQNKEKILWTSEELCEGETSDQANAPADKLAGLQIGAKLGPKKITQSGMVDPKLKLTVQRKNGEMIGYSLGTHDKDYVLKVSSRPGRYSLPG